MKTDKEFVPYQQSLDMKELGFDAQCLKLWEKTILFTSLVDTSEFKRVVAERYCPAPTFSQAFRWFREKHGIFVSIVPNRYGSLDSFIGWIYVPLNGSTKDINVGDYKIGFNTPEEAELECLKKLIEITKKK